MRDMFASLAADGSHSSDAPLYEYDLPQFPTNIQAGHLVNRDIDTLRQDLQREEQHVLDLTAHEWAHHIQSSDPEQLGNQIRLTRIARQHQVRFPMNVRTTNLPGTANAWHTVWQSLEMHVVRDQTADSNVPTQSRSRSPVGGHATAGIARVATCVPMALLGLRGVASEPLAHTDLIVSHQDVWPVCALLVLSIALVLIGLKNVLRRLRQMRTTTPLPVPAPFAFARPTPQTRPIARPATTNLSFDGTQRETPGMPWHIRHAMSVEAVARHAFDIEHVMQHGWFVQTDVHDEITNSLTRLSQRQGWQQHHNGRSDRVQPRILASRPEEGGTWSVSLVLDRCA